MKKSYLMGWMCGVFALSSCHIYQSYKRPASIDASGIYRSVTSETDTLASDTASIADWDWKMLIQDTKLQVLIQEGLERNVNMQAAVLRVQEAKTMLTAARLSFLPSLSLTPQGTSLSMDKADFVNSYQLPATASWEVDLFGKLLNNARNQKAVYWKSIYARQAVRSQLITSISNLYYTLLMLDRQVQIADETAVLWKDNLRVMEAMKQAGMVNEAAVTQSRAAIHQVNAQLIDLKRQVRETENALSVLLARAPQTIDRSTLAEQVLPKDLKAGIPLQLLENRPDVRVAEMNLAAAYYTTNMARAAFFPSIRITGMAGWTNGSGMTVFNPAQFMLQALASLTQPIFSNGKLVANLKVSKAEEEIARMNYQQTILQAGKEVSDALFLIESLDKKLVEDRGNVEQMTKAVSYTRDLFQTSSATYLEILTAQRNLLSAQLTEVADQMKMLQAAVTLYSAVGGGR